MVEQTAFTCKVVSSSLTTSTTVGLGLKCVYVRFVQINKDTGGCCKNACITVSIYRMLTLNARIDKVKPPYLNLVEFDQFFVGIEPYF
jgi:hypothetical protein